MHLAVVSHKVCWASKSGTASGYLTDGGFPLQMNAISELFSTTKIVVPCEISTDEDGLTPIAGKELSVVPLSVPSGQGLMRKLKLPFWLLANGPIIWREIYRADAVHAPIPGDVGSIGLIFALLLRKPLFVRHCGNWFVQRTVAERFWKWLMERVAGGRNVMLATGGSSEPPSTRNPEIGWIFSTSLRSAQMEGLQPRRFPDDGRLRLIIVCRQEEGKGTEIAIASLPLLLKSFPNVTLDVVGGGSLLEILREQAVMLGLENRVKFQGKVEQARVLTMLRDAHVFCYPTASEGFPKAVLEALACGLPVVTTRVSVLPELVRPGSGVLIDEATALAVTEAVLRITSNADDYVQMSQRALETAKEYTLEKWRDDIGKTLCTAWDVTELSRQEQIYSN